MPKGFRREDIEILPEIAKRVKENICMIIARIDRRLINVDVQELVARASSLHAMNAISKGTGFLISSGYVVTAYHVVKNAYKIESLTPRGNWINLKLTRYSELHDIALLEPEVKWSKGINVEMEEFHYPEKGELVFTLGYPLMYYNPEPLLSVGFLSNIQKADNIKKLIVNAAFNVGNSGGPLLNLQGTLLGVVVAKSIFPDPLMRTIIQALERPNIEIVYSTIKLPGGVTEEITLGKIIWILVRWVLNNIQTNIGEAISIDHLIPLLR
ncbi:MAG: S1 family peptidase [Candidatus Njordarchaeales archaeon]